MKRIANLRTGMYDIYFSYSIPTGNNSNMDEYITTLTQIEDALKLAKELKRNWAFDAGKRMDGGYYCVVDIYTNVIAIY